MNWDHRGRLWICETVDYPNDKQPDGHGRDRIRICEDTDGDGRADRFTVFAEGLSIPTSLAFAMGGVIVHQAPHTLFLKDTDGDDRADVRAVLFSGWSTADTHAGPSNLCYGLDNWYYGAVGYAGFRGTIAGQQHAFSKGFYRFRLAWPGGDADQADRRADRVPVVADLEFLRNTDNNTWGLGISEEGLIFGSTANRNPSVFLGIPNRYYERVRGWSSRVLEGIAPTHLFQPITDKVRQVDHHGGYTAAAGHALYAARTYPPAFWNRTAFVCGPTGHLVGTFLLEPEGAGFRATYRFNLLASDDEWTAPIAAEVGPDGNVWVIDWYNYIVQHNPTPVGFQTGKGNAYETPLRDKRHGRIYRVVFDRAAGAPVNGVGMQIGDRPQTEQLIRLLGHDNMFWRLHAQRLLVEQRRVEAVPSLLALVADRSVDDVGLNAGAVHALWTLHGLGQLDRAEGPAFEAAVAALRHPSPAVRRAALMTLPPAGKSCEAVVRAGLLEDENAQVQLAALLALADLPADRRAGARRSRGGSPTRRRMKIRGCAMGRLQLRPRTTFIF